MGVIIIFPSPTLGRTDFPGCVASRRDGAIRRHCAGRDIQCSSDPRKCNPSVVLTEVPDISSGMLHLCAPGEVQLTLPPGSESFPLSSAPTGHFLLPFQDYARYTSARAKAAPSAIKHLFTEGNSPTGEHSDGIT